MDDARLVQEGELAQAGGGVYLGWSTGAGREHRERPAHASYMEQLRR